MLQMTDFIKADITTKS